MARCYHCRSDEANNSYCPDCMSLDPFPRWRWLIQAFVSVVAAVAIGTAVMAALARIEPTQQAPEPPPIEAVGEASRQGKSLQVARGR
jgi:hypothetical protein